MDVLEKVFTNLTNGGPVLVYVKDDKIVRIRPLVFNDNDAPSWTIKAGGKKFTPLRKACVSPVYFGRKSPDIFRYQPEISSYQ